MTRSQLVPELVEEMAGSDRVVVVDASIESISSPPVWPNPEPTPP
jgi:hypothetical protein